MSPSQINWESFILLMPVRSLPHGTDRSISHKVVVGVHLSAGCSCSALLFSATRFNGLHI